MKRYTLACAKLSKARHILSFDMDVLPILILIFEQMSRVFSFGPAASFCLFLDRT